MNLLEYIFLLSSFDNLHPIISIYLYIYINLSIDLFVYIFLSSDIFTYPSIYLSPFEVSLMKLICDQSWFKTWIIINPYIPTSITSSIYLSIHSYYRYKWAYIYIYLSANLYSYLKLSIYLIIHLSNPNPVLFIKLYICLSGCLIFCV